ncbi:MAG: DUF2029 domain-containing protein [Pseudolabrys sp.]|nr:DUF2029 domain-containing protein [Pseudolabrys sp.]
MKWAPASDWRWRVVNAGCCLGIAFFVLYYLTGFHADLFTTLSRRADFVQWHYFPPLLREKLAYPSVAFNQWTLPFPYLPSAIALFSPLSLMSQTMAFGVWMALQAASLIVILRASLQLSGATAMPAYYLIALLAVLAADNPLGWDFRTHNNNLVYLAFVMLGLTARSAWLGGVLIAISANLKVYSGPLVAVLLWRREWRLATATIIAGLLIVTIVPVLYFGPSGFVQMMIGWFGQVDFHAPPGVAAILPPDPFRVAAAALAGAELDSAAATTMLWAMRGFWLAVVLAYYASTMRTPDLPDGRARLADACVILLAPLPFSHWFVGYHAVPLLPAYVVLLTVACDDEAPRRARIYAVGAIAAAQVVYYSIRTYELRAAIYLFVFTAVVAGLGLVRATIARRVER